MLLFFGVLGYNRLLLYWHWVEFFPFMKIKNVHKEPPWTMWWKFQFWVNNPCKSLHNLFSNTQNINSVIPHCNMPITTLMSNAYVGKWQSNFRGCSGLIRWQISMPEFNGCHLIAITEKVNQARGRIKCFRGMWIRVSILYVCVCGAGAQAATWDNHAHISTPPWSCRIRLFFPRRCPLPSALKSRDRALIHTRLCKGKINYQRDETLW